jgi:hypothetical protein
MKSPALLVLGAVLCVPATLGAAERTNFTGSYTLTPHKDSRKSEKESVKALTVVQTEKYIEVTEQEAGRKNTYHYPLSGPDGSYMTPTGLQGTCRGKLRKNDLILESFVTARPDPNGPLVQVHTKQKWELSTDLRTLRIHVDVDSPQSPIQIVDPWIDTYTRN